MSNQLPTLKLSDLTLAQNDDRQLAFTAKGLPVLVDPSSGQESPLADLPELNLGIGQAVAVPQRIQDAFVADGLAFETADFGLWLATVDGPGDEPAWFGSFTTAGVDLYGVHDLADDAMQLDGMSFDRLSLRVALQVRGSAVSRATFAIAGQVHINRSIAQVDLDGLTLICSLHLDVADVANLGALLAEPSHILDAAFTGRLHFSADARSLAIGDYFAIAEADCDFDIAVHSPKNDRRLHLGDIGFALRADSLTLVGAQVQDLDLSCGYESTSGRLFMRGAAAVTLPDLLDSVLEAGVNAVRGSVDFTHEPAGGDRITTLRIGIDALTLAPAINFLELGARDVTLAFTYRDSDSGGDVWTLSLSGVGCQSWSRLAARLSAAGIVRLSDTADLPDVQGTLVADLQDSASSGLLSYRLDFLRPGTGCRDDQAPVPFDNTFGPLPVRLADAHLALNLTFDAHQLGDWQIEGAGLLSTAAWLHDHLPVDRLTFSAGAYGSGGNLPSVELALTGGMPPLRLPPLIPGSAAMDIFHPQRLAVSLGEVLTIRGQALIPNPADLMTSLNLPDAWAGIVAPIGQVLTGLEATLAVSVPLADGDAPARLTLSLEPIDPPEFRLMAAIAEVVRSIDGSSASDPDHDHQIDASGQDFFTARPGKIEFALTAGGDRDFTLTLSFSFLCSVFGETFDATAAFRFVDGQPEFLLMAGLTDPIRLVIPGIRPDQVLGQADLSRIVADYRLDHHLGQIDTALFPDAVPTDAMATLQNLEARLRALFGSPGMDNSLVFEIRDFGLRVRLDQAPGISGTVRLVQLPGLLDAVMPENGFDFGLGCSLSRIFISVKGPATRSDSGLFEPHETDPLFSLPLGRANGQDQFLHLFFGRFELEYSWTTNAFGFVFDAAVVPAPASLQGLDLLGNGIYFPGQSTFVKISKPTTSGHLPIFIPEWAFSFAREASASVHVDSAADEMGLQLYVGVPGTRMFTAFFKEFTFSPTYYLMQPGVAFDGGIVIGPHQPLDYPSRKAFFNALAAGAGSDQLLIHFEIEKLVGLLMPSSLGAMLNPLALIPPFVSPMPPFWIYPPYYMGDIYFNSTSMSINLPNLLFFSIQLSRPLPSLSIQGMMELAALVMSGFVETIPDHSELRQVMYTTLEVNVALPLIEALGGGPAPALHLFFEVNAVDVINGLIRMADAVKDAVDTGTDIVATLMDDPSALVRMIPVEARRFTFPPPDHPTTVYRLLGLAFSGSLYVLTPEEFAAELKLFHEGKRELPKGLAASRPRSRIVAEPAGGSAPLTVQFSLAAAAGEPAIDSVRWDFGDKSGSSLSSPTHQFVQPGQYAVTVNSTDIDGQVRKTRRMIVVEGAAVHRPIQLRVDGVHQLTFVSNPLHYFPVGDDRFGAYLRNKAGKLFPSVRDARIAPQKVENRRRESVKQWLEQMWKPIAETLIGDAGARMKLWQKAGLEEIATDVEKLVKQAAGSTPADKPIHVLSAARQENLRQGLAKLVGKVLARYTLIEGPTATALAAQIARKVLQLVKRVSRGRSGTFTIKLLPADQRMALYKELLPPDGIGLVAKKIETCLEPAEKLAEAGKTLDADAAKVLMEKLTTCIESRIVLPPGRIVESLQSLPIFQANADTLFSLLAQRVATRAKTATKKVPVTVFDGALTMQWLGNRLSPISPPTDADTVEEMTGYAIVNRPHSSGNSFSVPVSHAAPLYRVQRYAGRYQLLLFEGREIVAMHALPDWLLNDLPETPDKPQKLRARLFVTERIVARPRTSAEAAWANSVIRIDDSYQRSIFARPEYTIKADGGIHGAMSIGDLLRRDGKYLVPDGPALLTGCILKVWDLFELKLAGLLAAPDNVFLNGYARLQLTLGRYTLALEGDFRMIAGGMWAAALAGSDDFTANAINFNGTAEFIDGGVIKLRGAAAGTIATDSTDLDITIDVEYHDSWTLEVAETELFKVTLDSNLAVQVTRNDTQFQLTVQSGLDVKAWRAEPEMRPVEILPALTACASVPILPPPLPDGPFFTTECITTPAVVVEVPDFSDPHWVEEVDATVVADLQFQLSTGALGITVSVAVLGHTGMFELPNLLND